MTIIAHDGQPTSGRMFAAAARVSVLMISTWGAFLGLVVPESPTAIVDVHAWLNLSVLAVAVLGFADVIWHDIGGRLLWPAIPMLLRHRVCVLSYSWFGSVWLMKAWVIAPAVGVVAGAAATLSFAISMAVTCGLVAVALTLETR